MEDAATAEISRSQLWQWMHQGIVTRESTPITARLIEGLLDETLDGAPRSPGDKFDEAAEVFRLVTLGDDYPTFLTIPAYARYLVDETASTETGPVRTLVGAAA
jgi:malate synthase